MSSRDPSPSIEAQRIIDELNLSPHPEGGYYRESYRDLPTAHDPRGASTAIYFLLTAGNDSHWHRIDAVEIWHYYAGAPLELSMAAPGEKKQSQILGPDVLAGQRPQGIVKPGDWQAARTLGDYTLVGCTVAPAFDFATFELAPKDWDPSSNL